MDSWIHWLRYKSRKILIWNRNRIMKTITHQSLSRLELGHEGWKEVRGIPTKGEGDSPSPTKGEGRVHEGKTAPRRKGERWVPPRRVKRDCKKNSVELLSVCTFSFFSLTSQDQIWSMTEESKRHLSPNWKDYPTMQNNGLHSHNLNLENTICPIDQVYWPNQNKLCKFHHRLYLNEIQYIQNMWVVWRDLGMLSYGVPCYSGCQAGPLHPTHRHARVPIVPSQTHQRSPLHKPTKKPSSQTHQKASFTNPPQIHWGWIKILER